MTGPSTMQRLEPHRLLRAAVSMSTWILPRGAVRERYHQELLAELHAIPSRQRASYARGVVVHAWALRLAVGDDQLVVQEDPMTRKPLTCRLNVHHTWHTFSTDDGGRYRRCTRCGKDQYVGGGPGDGSWPMAGAG